MVPLVANGYYYILSKARSSCQTQYLSSSCGPVMSATKTLWKISSVDGTPGLYNILSMESSDTCPSTRYLGFNWQDLGPCTNVRTMPSGSPVAWWIEQRSVGANPYYVMYRDADTTCSYGSLSTSQVCDSLSADCYYNTDDRQLWKLQVPDGMPTSTTGSWSVFRTLTSGITLTITDTVTTSYTQENFQQETFTAGLEASFGTELWFMSASLTATFSQELVHSITTALSSQTEQSNSMQITTEERYNQMPLWTWQWVIQSNLGPTKIISAWTITQNPSSLPCCLPGYCAQTSILGPHVCDSCTAPEGRMVQDSRCDPPPLTTPAGTAQVPTTTPAPLTTPAVTAQVPTASQIITTVPTMNAVPLSMEILMAQAPTSQIITTVPATTTVLVFMPTTLSLAMVNGAWRAASVTRFVAFAALAAPLAPWARADGIGP